MLFFHIFASRYVLLEGAFSSPKAVITYYFSPLCMHCLDKQAIEPNSLVVYQPVLMDDHNIQNQIFILSLIKKFRFSHFWEISKKFQKIKNIDTESMEQIAAKLGFSDIEIHWMKSHPEFQSAIEKELRFPVEAYLVNEHVHYKTFPDSHITHIPSMVKNCS